MSNSLLKIGQYFNQTLDKEVVTHSNKTSHPGQKGTISETHSLVEIITKLLKRDKHFQSSWITIFKNIKV